MMHDHSLFDPAAAGPLSDEPLGTAAGQAALAGGPAPAPPQPDNKAPSQPMPYVPVRAVEDVLALRMRQIHEFGHTLEADRAAPLSHLPKEALATLRAVIEDIQFNKPRAHMRRHALKAAAFLLAFVDRLDADADGHSESYP